MDGSHGAGRYPSLMAVLFSVLGWLGFFKHLQKAWGIWPGNLSDNTHTQNVTLSSGVIWDNFQSFQNQSEPMDLSTWVLGFWKTQWIFSHPFCWAAWAASDLDLYTKSTWQHKDSTVVWSPAICQKLSRTKVHSFDFSGPAWVWFSGEYFPGPWNKNFSFGGLPCLHIPGFEPTKFESADRRRRGWPNGDGITDLGLSQVHLKKRAGKPQKWHPDVW